ncbi:unnamed protein product [Adineta ricciae]|uniref:ARID domain-containing protein n=1 Tax=Adineta ricciae TaxID=249248 RepID=A0A814AAQ0_ADIRI|nr:unnamed protein product [Adineta ricciae]CAF0912238.1 unnamed protein product [Adineta ricciae]
MEREKMTMEIFDRLLKFGNESDRPLFCQRLQNIWNEQTISCQSYPTITNQMLDLYKLHNLVQERQGYLEITTNRGWKEISNILGFGDSGKEYYGKSSAAYSVKRNYIRLGLLAYECRFDRAGIDPRSVMEMAEMPHTVKKRKRGNICASTPVKISKQQFQTPHDPDETKKHLPLPIDIPSSRIPMQSLCLTDFQHLAFILRTGWLADMNKHLDTLLILLSEPRTACYFHLKSLPGLFNAIMEQYVACLHELFHQSFVQLSPPNGSCMDWFLQLKLRIDEGVIGPISNEQHLERLFFGTHRYVLKRLMTQSTNHQYMISIDRSHSLMIRCSCLSTIVRNLSFIEENDYLANDRYFIDILLEVLNCHHETMHQLFDCSHTQSLNESNCLLDDPLTCSKADSQQHFMYLLDNTFVTLANLSTFIELQHYHSTTRFRLVHTLIHWILCALSFADETFISMNMEEQMTNKKIHVSPREITLQIFAKLCTNESNVDFILLDLNWDEMQTFSRTLLSLMNSIKQEDTNREYCLIIICSLCKRNRSLVEYFSSQIICIELIFNYLEFYEYNQQQYLIATLASYYNASSTMPVNHSADMMIDSCIQLLLLFANTEEKNCLTMFEYRLLDMSASIYFEQRILKAFAEILYLINS